MTKKEVLQKIAFLGSLGARAGASVMKMAPKTMGPKLVDWAGKNPRLFSGTGGAIGGGLIGAGIGAVKDPGVDENGNRKSVFQNVVRGAGIGALAGGTLGATAGKNFARGMGKTNLAMKMKGIKPIPKVTTPTVTTPVAGANKTSIMGGKETSTVNPDILTQVRAAKAGKEITPLKDTKNLLFTEPNSKGKIGLWDRIKAIVGKKKIINKNDVSLDPSLGDSFKVTGTFKQPYRNMSFADKKLHQGRNKFK